MRFSLLITAAVLATGSARATDVGVSVSVGDSGFYGRIDVGEHPKPQVISPIPVVVQPMPAQAQQRPPIYLRVPPGHAKHWSKHCREYNACGERVLFVEERWYTEVYAPGHPSQGGQPGENPGHGHGHGHGKGHKDS